jgi:hypothetical protein
VAFPHASFFYPRSFVVGSSTTPLHLAKYLSPVLQNNISPQNFVLVK